MSLHYLRNNFLLSQFNKKHNRVQNPLPEGKYKNNSWKICHSLQQIKSLTKTNEYMYFFIWQEEKNCPSNFSTLPYTHAKSLHLWRNRTTTSKRKPKNETFTKQNLNKAKQTQSHLWAPAMPAGDPTPIISVRATGTPSSARTESERCFKAAIVLKVLHGQRGEWEATQTTQSRKQLLEVECRLPPCLQTQDCNCG